jgi:hypothetical protein
MMAIRKLDVEALKASLQYDKDFRGMLEDVARHALNPDPALGAIEFASLYMPEELIAATEAAQKAGLSLNEGVAYFVFLAAAERAKAQQRGETPRMMDCHIAMTNFAIKEMLGGNLDRNKSLPFSEIYWQSLATIFAREKPIES